MVGREWLGMRRPRRGAGAEAAEAEEAALKDGSRPRPAIVIASWCKLVGEHARRPRAGRAAHLPGRRARSSTPTACSAWPEIELLGPTDRKVRAADPKCLQARLGRAPPSARAALVDLGYVLFEATRLVRAIARGSTAPGRAGSACSGCSASVIAHLAVTGSIAGGRQPRPADPGPRAGLQALRPAGRRRGQRADDRPHRNRGHGPAAARCRSRRCRRPESAISWATWPAATAETAVLIALRVAGGPRSVYLDVQ